MKHPANWPTDGLLFMLSKNERNHKSHDSYCICIHVCIGEKKRKNLKNKKVENMQVEWGRVIAGPDWSSRSDLWACYMNDSIMAEFIKYAWPPWTLRSLFFQTITGLYWIPSGSLQTISLINEFSVSHCKSYFDLVK